MLLLVLMLLAPAGASAGGASDARALVPRRPPSGQCRIVGLSPRLAPERPTPSRRGVGAASERIPARGAPPSRESAEALEEGSARAPREADGRASPGRPEREVRPRPVFSAARTLDLDLGAERLGARAGIPVELRLYTPKGHLYQTLHVTATDRNAPTARGSSGAEAAWPLVARLPVAGTAVVNHSLYGQWTVEPYLEGHSEPCGEASRFWIEP